MKTIVFMLVAALGAQAAVITLNNHGFEAGNASGWTTTGIVNVQGTATISGGPNTWLYGPAGSYLAVLSSGAGSSMPSISALETFFGVTPGLLSGGLPPGNATVGSGIYQDFSGNAGDTVRMYWAYAATDYVPYNDPAFAFVRGPSVEQLTVLASIYNGGITVGSFGATGWQSFVYTLPATGTYRLGFGVVNTQDTVVPGFLLLDNASGTFSGEIPEPGAFVLVGAGLLALGALRLRRTAA
jgi:hypothetical protein